MKELDQHQEEDLELNTALTHILEIAGEFKLDPFPIDYEIAPPTVINEIAAYGIPTRFSHWTFGRTYRYQKTMYDYGLSKIYELIINSNPAQAFLLENNSPLENKFVMAHVLGHSDFFKNNFRFATTRRDMPESCFHNAQRIEEYGRTEGKLRVEKLIDSLMTIDEHIDPFLIHRPGRDEELTRWKRMTKVKPAKQISEFDDLYSDNKDPEEEEYSSPLRIPPEPDKDVLGFIRNHAPYLETWERDVVDIIRDESLYFWPQKRTKIMNEGWASYWHKRIMREMGDQGFLTEEENEAWWKLHSGVVAPNPKKLNPYYMGMKIYEYLEDYYNGNLEVQEQDWLKQQGYVIFPKFEGKLADSPALPHLREVMEREDDQSFIGRYFDKNVADRLEMYIYEEHGEGDNKYYVVKDKSWEIIRDYLSASMVNCGDPYIVVANGDFNRNSELYLRHQFEGQELDKEYIAKTLPHIFNLWRKKVFLETVEDEQKTVYSYDGFNTERIKK
jgi:stage V sporulation protein R